MSESKTTSSQKTVETLDSAYFFKLSEVFSQFSDEFLKIAEHLQNLDTTVDVKSIKTLRNGIEGIYAGLKRSKEAVEDSKMKHITEEILKLEQKATQPRKAAESKTPYRKGKKS